MDVRLGRLADKQHGVLRRAQIRALGITDDELRGRVERGNLIRLHRGVYALARRGVGQRGHLQAALLALPAGAFFSHRTAAGLHGLRAVNVYDIHLTAGTGRPRTRRAMHIHSTRGELQRWELTNIAGLRVSAIPRTLVDLSAVETVEELRRLIDLAVTRQILNHDRLRQSLDLHAGKPGIGKLRSAYYDYERAPAGRASNLERAFDRLLLAHPEIPQPLRNVTLHGWEVDCYWPQYGLVLELDGRGYHSTFRNIERDRLRDARLLAYGIRTLRVTDARFEYDKQGLIADLKAALAAAVADAA